MRPGIAGPIVEPAVAPAVGPALRPEVVPAIQPGIRYATAPVIPSAAGHAVAPVARPAHPPATRPGVVRPIGPATGPAPRPAAGVAVAQILGPAVGPAVRLVRAPALVPAVRSAARLVVRRSHTRFARVTSGQSAVCSIGTERPFGPREPEDRHLRGRRARRRCADFKVPVTGGGSGDWRLTIADFRVTSSEFGRWFFFRMTTTGFQVPSGVHLRASGPDRKRKKANLAFILSEFGCNNKKRARVHAKLVERR